MTHAIHEVIRAIEHSNNVTFPVELRLPSKGYWYKNEPEYPRHVGWQWNLSTALHRIAARVDQQYIRCTDHVSLDVAAVARIAYDAGRRWTEKNTFDQCLSTLRRLSDISTAMWPRQRCPYFLATDWFVGADGGLPQAPSRAIQRCWVLVNSNSSSPFWWWLDDRMLNRIVAGEPSMEQALMLDPSGLRTFLELALLARASTRIAKSHLGDVANRVRSHLGKTACLER